LFLGKITEENILRLFLIGLIIVPSLVFSSVSPFKLSLIYSKLCLGIKKPPRLVINMDLNEGPNGAYDKKTNTIIINQTLLDIADEDTIAMTLGHELGHAKYKHKKSPLMRSKISHKQEYQADQEGKKLANKYGYNACKGFKWIYNTHSKGEYWHPDADKRYRKLGCIK
jgi:Zn-dependent protease with chaperone function